MGLIIIPVHRPMDVSWKDHVDLSADPEFKTIIFSKVPFHGTNYRPSTALLCGNCQTVIYCSKMDDMIELASVHANKQHKWSEI